MVRVVRVFRLLDLLRSAGPTTVRAVAGELGVTERTVLRDLATLRESSWPIQGDAGPGGGIRLEWTPGVSAIHLTEDEVAALWLATRLSASVSQIPWSRTARAALHKLLASLPKERARSVRALIRRVHVGRPASPQVSWAPLLRNSLACSSGPSASGSVSSSITVTVMATGHTGVSSRTGSSWRPPPGTSSPGMRRPAPRDCSAWTASGAHVP